jgi:hypothetical protein
MARMLRGTLITCQVSEADGGLLARGSCRVAGTDLAKELVRSGHVFASDGARAHAKLERGAREAKLGLWRGDAERPSIYRAKRWEEARKSAPSGCPIKGQITADGGRVYLLPWSPRYERAKIQSSRGGRWFCSEAEAQAAGWKSGQRS